ncbi:ABC transporter ATP-binding protein [Luteimicrobium xylanilyticum]|uniref:ATP-binding cassette sub-family B member 10, mitochondrial n=1 Tax=Luteimicrobium xylanilyticum TaxID=1133546 RepID=A0A5P9Q9E1_9MICO|nr:ATP-binding cassette domain-containing protein [Luteimicrobium xylanilyticum]QFU97682.1 ATP-binding cassette sub-family B member 10, mitochondrial [Luteimicrobium xylanilyticum]
MTEAVLAARDLTFAYQRQPRPVIVDFDHDVLRGSTTALTGPSGRGKSTLLYLLGLMVRPSSGRVLVAGHGASDLSDAQRARVRAHHFGFVFQDAALDPTRSVLDNVTEPAIYGEMDRVDAVARAAALMSRFDVDLPPGHRPGQVSGGQAARLALCRALLLAPPIVLADEPTGNLDDAAATVVMNGLLEHAAEGGTVVIATHDTRVVARCDVVVTL